jgi:hypothetical protein
MFEKAAKMKLRFPSSRGNLTVEDLWDFTLKDLNSIAKGLNKKIKSMDEEDFLEDISKEDGVIKLKFDIVLHVLNTKKEENKIKRDITVKKEKKEKILSIIEKKQDASLENMSEEELKKALEEL